MLSASIAIPFLGQTGNGCNTFLSVTHFFWDECSNF